jgi:3-phosphoshikimate 1-carboxyvinyltransferase
MQVFNYSGRDFSPYRDDEVAPGSVPGPWQTPNALRPLAATIQLPGSKSLTNRELILSAVADSPSRLRAPLHSRDTTLMIEALRALGTTIERTEATGAFGDDLLITPGELTGSTSIDCGLAGTVMRFVPPLAALALGPVSFDGDEAARKRPMRTTITALRALGVDVSDDGRGSLPFSLFGTGAIEGGELEIDASASSQFVSGLLLVAPRFAKGLILRHTGSTLPSQPHIEMTLAVLAARGVVVETPEPGVWVVPASSIAGRDVLIEPDLSNAGPFLSAALVAGGSVTVTGWPEHTTQVGTQMGPILERMGGTVSWQATGAGVGSLTVTGTGTVRGIDLHEASELAPTVAAVAALADSPTTLTGIAHLRGHETDRLAALVAEINGLGGDATETDDGLVIRPAPLHGGLWHAYDDHRMAMAGAIVGLAVPHVDVDDIKSTAKTLPEFPDLWLSLVQGENVRIDTHIDLPESPAHP